MPRKFEFRSLRNLLRTIRQRGKKRTWYYAGALILALLFLLLPVLTYRNFQHAPFGNGNTVKIFDFSKGYTMNRIADELERSRIISSSFLFSLYSRLQGADDRVKAGTYRFSDSMPPAEILRKLVAGEVYELRFSVPEGYSVYQIAELLEHRGIFRKESFLRNCFSQSLLHELGIKAKSVEGYLYPATYTIKPTTDDRSLIRDMVTRFRSVYDGKFAQQAKLSGLPQSEILTLASMIEKEAVVPQERPVIASVFLNRMKKNMPLQSDPTSVYGVRAFAGRISKQDILRDNPYNTYRIKGLPPGPIGNPGDAAIEAVLSPARTRYLYFVARKDGTHQFSLSLEEHNRAVQRYLKPAESTADTPGTEIRTDRPGLKGGK
jgi:UPF0755 protein